MKINEEKMKLFWYYISERHSIYEKRSRGLQRPWTDDPILQQYKFTNVFRYLDPGTRYIIDKIIPNCKKPEDLIFNLIVYRLYNKTGTHEYVGIQSARRFDRKAFEAKLRELAKTETVFTNAFIVSGYSFIKTDKDKIGKTCTILEDIASQVPRLTEEIIKRKDSKFTFETLENLRGIGEFLAYQIAVDIGYWNREVFNEDRFVVAGPGCKNGIDRIFIERDGNYEDCIQHLVDIQGKYLKKWNDEKLNLMAIENCLCEFSKYFKAHINEGRPRNRYN